MGITVAESGNAPAMSTSTPSFQYTVDIPAGSTLVVIFEYFDSTHGPISSIASAENTFVRVAGPYNGDALGAGIATAEVWWVQSAVAQLHTSSINITIVAGPASLVGAWFYRLSTSHGKIVLDQVARHTDTNNGAVGVNGGPVTTRFADELLVGWAGCDNDVTAYPTAWTGDGHLSSGDRGAHLVVSAVGTYDSIFTYTTGGQTAQAAMVTFGAQDSFGPGYAAGELDFQWGGTDGMG